ncbi:hypothetical protein GCM10020216_015030 [Nonomuraea helvata]
MGQLISHTQTRPTVAATPQPSSGDNSGTPSRQAPAAMTTPAPSDVSTRLTDMTRFPARPLDPDLTAPTSQRAPAANIPQPGSGPPRV